MPKHESYLPRIVLTVLREHVHFGAAARARVMMRVRAAARSVEEGPATGRVPTRSRGAARPAVLGALLAASVVVSIVSAGRAGDGDHESGRSLADTIAVHFAGAASAIRPVIEQERYIAVADATREFAARAHAGAPPLHRAGSSGRDN